MHFKQKLAYMALGCLFTIIGYILASLSGNPDTAEMEPLTDAGIAERIELFKEVVKEGRITPSEIIVLLKERDYSDSDILTIIERVILDEDAAEMEPMTARGVKEVREWVNGEIDDGRLTRAQVITVLRKGNYSDTDIVNILGGE